MSSDEDKKQSKKDKKQDEEIEEDKNSSIMESNFVQYLVAPAGYDDTNFTNLKNDSAESGLIQIECANPSNIEKLGKMFSHVVYLVKGHDKNGPFETTRRYSDFWELRKKLIENWPGIFIPALPGKKSVGNKGKEFVASRCKDLNMFLNECRKRPYLIYSEEFQIFLRNTNENVAKFIEGMKVDSDENLLAKYEATYPEYKDGDGEELKVDSFFLNLDKTVGYFKEFKDTTRKLRETRKREKFLSNRWYNIMLIDIKSKCDAGTYESFNENVQAFTATMEDDELKNYSDTLRQIEKEMKAFLDVKKGLKGMKKRIEKVKEDKFKISGEINKLNTTPGDTIKISLFKKVPKAQRIDELSAQVSKLEKEDANLHKVLKIAWNVIHDNEFPKLILFKRFHFAHGTTAALNERQKVLVNEEKLMGSVFTYYRNYLDNHPSAP